MRYIPRILSISLFVFTAACNVGMSAQNRTDDILSIIAGSADSIGIDHTAVGALDFMTEAYSSAGFYETGEWETALFDGEFGGTLFVRDEKSVLTSGFGYRARFRRHHLGIDIAMPVGDTVRCARSGIVTKVAFDAKGYGNYVVVHHGNRFETRYAHLYKPMVVEGMNVTAGQPLGLSGNSGNSTGPHLHFETRIDGTPVDPTPYVMRKQTKKTS